MKRTRLVMTALVLTATACTASAGEPSTATDATETVATPVDTALGPPSSDPTPGPTPNATTASGPTTTAGPATTVSTTMSTATTPDSESSTTVSTAPPPIVKPLYESGDIDSGLQPFIEQAIQDLAARLNVEASRISVRAAVLVVWPDASVGCPQPGMSYAQVITDGSIIELEHDGNSYRYHTGGTKGPFICEQPLSKAPPTELLTLEDFADD